MDKVAFDDVRAARPPLYRMPWTESLLTASVLVRNLTVFCAIVLSSAVEGLSIHSPIIVAFAPEEPLPAAIVRFETIFPATAAPPLCETMPYVFEMAFKELFTIGAAPNPTVLLWIVFVAPVFVCGRMP